MIYVTMVTKLLPVAYRDSILKKSVNVGSHVSFSGAVQPLYGDHLSRIMVTVTIHCSS